jgi:hypothetical protein
MTQTLTSRFDLPADRKPDHPTPAPVRAGHHDLPSLKSRGGVATGRGVTSGFSSEQAYPIQVNLEYRLAGSAETAPGTTVSISSKRILFKPEHPIPAGSKIEAFVVWPVRLNNAIHLKLHVHGETLGAEGGGNGAAVIKIHKYMLRTAAQV